MDVGTLILIAVAVCCSTVGEAAKLCQDHKCDCSGWARKGYCKSSSKYSKYVTSRCPLTCGRCTKVPSTCVDSNPSCPAWKKRDGCCQNPGYMLGMCRKSCGVCTWGKWSSYTTCTKSCGGGIKTRTRACPGKGCPGKAKKYYYCNLDSCPAAVAPSTWGKWSSFGPCTKSCGGGIKTRTRVCSTKKGCPGKAKKFYYCNLNSCPAAPSTSSASSLKCGTGHVRARWTRIVGGKNAGIWPWQVGLYHSKYGDKPSCGGTLISNRLVLTAAHCFEGNSYGKLWVRVGDYDLRKKERYQATMWPSRSFIHYNWKDGKNDLQGDIALLVLPRPVRFVNKHINAACLPGPNEVFRVGTYCTITGWGKLHEAKHSKQPRFLQEAYIPLVSRSTCWNAYQGGIYPTQVCAGHKKGGVDSCQGDSGGPLVCKRKDGSYVLLGITSFGRGCARPGMYGVYTDTRKYLQWIRSKAKLV